MPFKKGEQWNGNPNGRPKGKTFRDYWNEEEIADLVKEVKEHYKEKPEILKLVVEHIFGKPQQAIDLTSGGKPIPPFDYVKRTTNRNNKK